MITVGAANCVTNMPPREFDVPSGRNYIVYEINKHEFDELTCGRTSIQNISNFCKSILLL
jgi:hypothetical protein